uniref:GDP-Man:Man(3)GlcNAc(2)-PP-Dol alpha-1,2-mannosyltransferase n=1 Tax=Sexangularia sp. CB-2014 TaxID=1486929 RepID=A0A7S1VGQ8_9EUKA
MRLLVPHATLLAYTHYPTISTAMIGSLGTDRPTVHDAGRSGRAWLLAKRAYFYLCWYLYGLAGRCLDASLVNSTWTRDHLRHVWGPTVPLAIVYPPCAVAALARVPLAAPARARRRLIVSLAQFRPEKEQDKQLAAFAQFVADSPKRADGATLVVAGGARHDLDWARVHQLERLADDLGIRPRVTFLVNAPFDEIAELLSNAAVGLHTMWNEHFGIGVVEFMAAGVVPIAHASGGPLTDIVGPSLATDEPVGFLADTVAEYAAALAQALPEEGDARAARRIAAMRAAARQRAHLFSDDVFAEQISSML